MTDGKDVHLWLYMVLEGLLNAMDCRQDKCEDDTK